MFEALISLAVFSFLEAFFALSEISFVSAEKMLIERISAKNRSARICLRFWQDPERLFTTTTLGITLSIAGNGIFTSYLLIRVFKGWGIILSSFVLPFFILLFGQILPKSIGKKLAYPLVLYLAPPLYFISYLFYPIYFLNQRFLGLFLKNEDHNRPYFLTRFREVFLTMISYEREIDLMEKRLMQSILEFGRKKVVQVMIPLPKVKALPLDATLEEALEFTSKYNFSYIPLYEGDPSKIKYILRVQDILGKVLTEKKIPLIRLARAPLFIPELIPAHQALKMMQESAQEISIVVDEYGLVTGILTIEDLVEEVLGEFRDALDYHEPELKRLSPEEFLVKGWIEIEKLQELGLPIPSGDYETLNGFIYHILKRIPERGEIINYKNLKIIIHRAVPQRVEEVILKLKD